MAGQIKHEVSIMRRLKHPNVVELKDVMATNSKVRHLSATHFRFPLPHLIRQVLLPERKRPLKTRTVSFKLVSFDLILVAETTFSLTLPSNLVSARNPQIVFPQNH